MTQTVTKMNLTQIKEQLLAEKVASSKKILRIRQQMLLMMVKKMLVENKEFLSFDQICSHPLVIKAADRFDITPKTLIDYISNDRWMALTEHIIF
jgi:hypothetical protein